MTSANTIDLYETGQIGSGLWHQTAASAEISHREHNAPMYVIFLSGISVISQGTSFIRDVVYL